MEKIFNFLTEQQENEEKYLEFIYCLYKGKFKESNFLYYSEENKSFREKAIESYRIDPIFHAIYNLNKNFIKEYFKNDVTKD